MHRRHVLWGLVSGLVGGIVAFLYARVFVEPHVAAAIGYEADRSGALASLTGDHDHDHEIFTRTVQENVGAGVGTVVFALAMGAFFGVAFTLLWSHLETRWPNTDPRWVAAGTAGCLFVGIYLVPTLVYPADPPAVGRPDTIGARSAAFLSITIVSVLAMIAAVVVVLALRSRLGGLVATASGVVGYLVVMIVAAQLLPRFDEVPTPLTDTQGRLAFPGFPATTLAEFRMQSLAAQFVLWAVLAVTFATLCTVTTARRRRTTADSRPTVDIH